jgi:ATP-dependent Lhr-like helicase
VGRPYGRARHGRGLRGHQASNTALIFVNTRFQAEFAFQRCGELNDDRPADRPAPRQPGGRAAAQGRGGDGARRAAGRGLHLDPGHGHRLGRRRPGHPAGRAQGGLADGAADRPRQPPAGRAVRALFVPASRFEMLECQAPPRGDRREHLDGDPPIPARWTCWPSTSWAAPAPSPSICWRSTTRSLRGSLSRAVLGGFRGGRRFRLHRRLRAAHLRPFRRIVKTQDGLWKVRNAADRPAPPDERRGHRLAGHAVNIRIGGGAALIGGPQDRRGRGGLFRAADAGDTFVFAGQVWRFHGDHGNRRLVTPGQPQGPEDAQSWGGSKFPLSTYLAKPGAPDDARPATNGACLPPTCRSGWRRRRTAR